VILIDDIAGCSGGEKDCGVCWKEGVLFLRGGMAKALIFA
jgi:hypothetical protein